MAKDPPPNYSEEERITDYLNRQQETKQILKDWSETKEFNSMIAEVVYEQIFTKQEKLADLSDIFFKNLTFIELLQKKISQEIDNHRKNKWWKRWQDWCRLAISVMTTFFLTKAFGFLL